MSMTRAVIGSGFALLGVLERPGVMLGGLCDAISETEVGIGHHEVHNGLLAKAGVLVVLPKPVRELAAVLEEILHHSADILIVVLRCLGDVVGALNLFKAVLNISPFLLPGLEGVADFDGGRGDFRRCPDLMDEDSGVTSCATTLRAGLVDRDVIQPGATVGAVHHHGECTCLPRGRPGWHRGEAASTTTPTSAQSSHQIENRRPIYVGRQVRRDRLEIILVMLVLVQAITSW
jgi:hypothetical protein